MPSRPPLLAVMVFVSLVLAAPARLRAEDNDAPDQLVAAGACCFVNETCQVLDAATCAIQGGLYQGDSSTCTEGLCVDLGPFGACCIWSEYTCEIRTPQDCAAVGGSYFGDGSDCSPCMRPSGACCLPGTCISPTYREDCEAAGGDYQGDFSFCEGPCEIGACCLTDGSCYDLNVLLCEGFGGTYQGDGSVCEPEVCSTPTGVPTPPESQAVQPKSWGRIKVLFR
jgi:hypothetical protein